MMKKLGVKVLALAIFVVLWVFGACIVAALGGGMLFQIAWLCIAFKVSGKLDGALLDK